MKKSSKINLKKLNYKYIAKRSETVKNQPQTFKINFQVEDYLDDEFVPVEEVR